MKVNIQMLFRDINADKAGVFHDPSL
jgi:hypothetical protein